ncbi:hypothetical protein SKAU_G00096110 [Synaphobranchus kaupii]|uniref:Uncharacterized protein n=1 Tax=Synaphobranchus kaupii TaxID=118154 RepID=A0A9Q1FYH6_SYNKA|nr:hypothetical protein SKAU_G00096110 [Synaphobranchus kaupii]
MPEGCLRFGFLSNPGACATVLRKEVMAAKVEVEPDLVCLMAPCNTGRMTIEEAGREFGKLLLSAVERWPNVFVLDFPTRLSEDLDNQEMLRQEYNRVAVRFKVRYISTAAQFPVQMTELWCRDGLEVPPPSLPQPPRKPAPPVKTFIPTLVVTGEVRVPRGKSSHDWTEVTSGMRKTTADDFQGLLRDSHGSICHILGTTVICNPIGYTRQRRNREAGSQTREQNRKVKSKQNRTEKRKMEKAAKDRKGKPAGQNGMIEGQVAETEAFNQGTCTGQMLGSEHLWMQGKWKSVQYKALSMSKKWNILQWGMWVCLCSLVQEYSGTTRGSSSQGSCQSLVPHHPMQRARQKPSSVDLSREATTPSPSIKGLLEATTRPPCPDVPPEAIASLSSQKGPLRPPFSISPDCLSQQAFQRLP